MPKTIEHGETTGNGAHEPPARRLPRRVERVRLPAPYDDFSVTAWLNFPRSLIVRLQALPRDTPEGDAEAGRLIGQIVIDHDLVDFDGAPYPPTTDPAFWEEIPPDLQAILISEVFGRVGKVPKAN